MIVEMAGFQVELTRKRIKRINLRINSAAQISVSAPMKCPLKIIEGFLQEKQDWITRHLLRLQTQPEIIPVQFTSGETHWFQGESCQLLIYDNAKKMQVHKEENRLHLFVKQGASLEDKQNLLESWYKQQLKALLPALIKKWEPVIGVQVNSWGVKRMKTRWGSCNPLKKRIWLNSSLMRKPSACLEYVLVHEMVHLLEASHNKRFYALMSQFMPEWEIYRQKLKGSC